MALENLVGADKYLSALQPTNPVGADDKREGDDHVRGIKNTLRNSFPNVGGAVTATHGELSAVTAKVNRSGDDMTGSLTVAGNLGVGTLTPAAFGKFAVVGGAFDFFANPGAAGTHTRIGSVGAQPLVLSVGGVANVQLGSDGITRLGETTPGGIADGGTNIRPGAGAEVHIGHKAAVVDGSHYAVFFYNGGGIGTITQASGGAAVTYNTTSDHRLKDITGPLTGSDAFIDGLRPVYGRWKSSGAPFVGFLAHELQAFAPDSVTGTMDAVDAKGAPVYQQVAYGSGEIIANLVAELQALRQRVATLEQFVVL